jgi:hypothetical protein
MIRDILKILLIHFQSTSNKIKQQKFGAGGLLHLQGSNIFIEEVFVFFIGKHFIDLAMSDPIPIPRRLRLLGMTCFVLCHSEPRRGEESERSSNYSHVSGKRRLEHNFSFQTSRR